MLDGNEHERAVDAPNLSMGGEAEGSVCDDVDARGMAQGAASLLLIWMETAGPSC